MSVAIRLPAFLPHMTIATIREVHVREGETLRAGAALADIFVDLSGGYAYDCAPAGSYRLTLGEPGKIIAVAMRKGQNAAVLDQLAVLEPARAGEAERDAVVLVASVMLHDDWWDEEQAGS